jgi:hypothetical protein
MPSTIFQDAIVKEHKCDTTDMASNNVCFGFICDILIGGGAFRQAFAERMIVAFKTVNSILASSVNIYSDERNGRGQRDGRGEKEREETKKRKMWEKMGNRITREAHNEKTQQTHSWNDHEKT